MSTYIQPRSRIQPYAYAWDVAPPGSQPFDFHAGVVVPAAGSAVVVVLSFQVPSGYNGVILGLSHVLDGPGFSQGSGDLVWRLRVDRQYVRNYGNLTVSFGSIEQPRPVAGGILLRSSQTVYYEFLNVAYAAGAARSLVSVQGYFWPQEEMVDDV